MPFAESAGMNTWFDVSCTSEKNPGLILELLMEAKEVRNKYSLQHYLSVDVLFI